MTIEFACQVCKERSACQLFGVILIQQSVKSLFSDPLQFDDAPQEFKEMHALQVGF
jgi:hypothetical protein